MKKIIYAAIAAIGLWLSPSCSNEEELLGSGDEAQVSFTVNLADGIQTKAIADGTTARNLVVGVFEKNGEAYQEVTGIDRATTTFNADLKANVSFKLMKGKTYSFIFWAQSGSVENSRTTAGSPYDLRDLQDIQVSYTGATANDESRDAFLGVVKDYPVTGNFTKDVELKRPFAQLNFMVTEEELNKAIAAGLTIEKSSITLSQVASKLQPLKGTVSDYQENVTFAAANVSIDMDNITNSQNTQTLPTYAGSSETTYYYLATTYFLVAAGTTDAENSGKERAMLTSANMKIDRAEGNGLTANSVPVQWNYRTNIYGPLLTAPGTFNVEIKEGFAGDYNEYQESVTVNTINKVADAIQRGATTITVKDAPTSDETIAIPQVADGDNKNITLNLPALNSKVTISQASDEDAGTKSPKKVNVNTTSATNVVIDLPDATVTLNGGTYNQVTASTADNTLIIPEGVTVNTLKVEQGNVEIYGVVDKIELTGERSKILTPYHVKTVEALKSAFTAASAGKCDEIVIAADMDITSMGAVEIINPLTLTVDAHVTTSCVWQFTNLSDMILKGTERGAYTVSTGSNSSNPGRGVIYNGKSDGSVSATLVIEGGTWNTECNTRGSAFYNYSNATMKLNDVTVNAAFYAVYGDGGTVLINGGNFTSTSSNKHGSWAYCIKAQSGCNMTITDATVKGVQGCIAATNGSTIEVTNVTATAKNSDASHQDAFYALYSASDAMLIVNSGSFSSDRTPCCLASDDDIANAPFGGFTLKGGKYSSQPMNDAVSPNEIWPAATGYQYQEITEGDYKWEIVPVE